MGLGDKIIQAQKERQNYVLVCCGDKSSTGANIKTPRRAYVCCRFRTSKHMLSKKDLSSDEMETLQRSRNPTTVVTANGEVQTNEEAQIYVHDLDLFVTVQLLDATPAVLSLGKLRSEHGYSYEWINGQEPHLTKDGNVIAGKRTTSYLLSYQDCHHLPPTARLLHRNQGISQIIPVNREPHYIQ